MQVSIAQALRRSIIRTLTMVRKLKLFPTYKQKHYFILTALCLSWRVNLKL